MDTNSVVVVVPTQEYRSRIIKVIFWQHRVKPQTITQDIILFTNMTGEQLNRGRASNPVYWIEKTTWPTELISTYYISHNCCITVAKQDCRYKSGCILRNYPIEVGPTYWSTTQFLFFSHLTDISNVKSQTMERP